LEIPFISLRNQHETLRERLLEKMQKALDENAFILGKEVEEFEEAYARFSGTKYCIGASNGTDALKICLRSLSIGPGHEVIIPANTFVATAVAVMEVGATVVLADPEPDTYNLSAKTILPRITSKTKAIIPVHLYGNPCPMDEIMQLANEKSLHVIEDNAQAQGASYKGQPTGSFGTINATSFYPSKNLGALGDAGAITTQHEELYDEARLWRNLGTTAKYRHEIPGYNARLDSLQAAFLSVKLPFLAQWNNERRRIAERYTRNLSNVSSLVLPTTHTMGEHVFHLFVIQTPERDKLQLALAQQKIQTLIHYPVPIHLQLAFKSLGHTCGHFPVSEKLSNQILSLPLFIGIADDEIDYVCEHIIQFHK